MIHTIEKIPITKKSHPFSSAINKCRFEKKGYIEEEYFFSGISNVYGWDNSDKIILYKNAPYVNRFIVRKPNDKYKFSGNVIIEILNSTSFIDFDRVWVLNYKHMMRKGDIYIGITSKPNVIPAMQKMDYNRYKWLEWPNPCKQQIQVPLEMLGNMEGASSPETEDGLFWDMLIDLAELLRDKNNEILQGYGQYYQYLSGWSQSAAYMLRFIKTFAYEKKRENSLFDGYFSCGGASICMPDINQSYGQTAGKSNRKLDYIPQPYIEVHTESENQKWGNYEARGENSHTPDMKYRIYDIACTSHDAKISMFDYYLGDKDVYNCGIIPNYPGKEIYPNDYPYEIVFQAALEHLYHWTREGIIPPVIQAIEVDDLYENVTDDFGNAKGGWRLPFITYPLCTYHITCTPMKPEFISSAKLFGHNELFSQNKAVQLYGTLHNYCKLIEEETQKCIEKGLLLEEDKDTCIEYSLMLAKLVGLK